MLFQLKRQRFPNKILLLIYNSFILPHFNYCNTLWGYSSHTYLNILEKLHSKCKYLINIPESMKSIKLLITFKTIVFYITSLCNVRSYFNSTLLNQMRTTGRYIYNLKLNHVKKTIRFNTILYKGRLDEFINTHSINPFTISMPRLKVKFK